MINCISGNEDRAGSLGVPAKNNFNSTIVFSVISIVGLLLMGIGGTTGLIAFKTSLISLTSKQAIFLTISITAVGGALLVTGVLCIGLNCRKKSSLPISVAANLE